MSSRHSASVVWNPPPGALRRERRHRIDRLQEARIARIGVDARQNAACVVRVIALSPVGVELGARPGPEHERRFRQDLVRALGAGVFRQAARDVEAELLGARAEHGARPVGPVRVVLRPEPERILVDVVLAHDRERLALFRERERHRVDAVVAARETDGVLELDRVPAALPALREVEPADLAPVRLLELVAVDRVVQEVGEVRPQVEAVVDEIRVGGGRAGRIGARPLARERVARRPPAVGRVERPEPADQAGLQGAERHLVGGRPLAAVAHRRDRPSVREVAHRIGGHPVQLPVVLRHLPRPVVVEELARDEQVARPELRRRGGERAAIAVAAVLQLREVLRHDAEIVDEDAPRRGEVADVGVIRALAVVHAPHELGDHEVEGEIALAVRVGGHVDRHSRDAR